MKIKEIIEILSKYDENLDVYIPCTDSEYEFYKTYTVEIRELQIKDEPEMVMVIDFE